MRRSAAAIAFIAALGPAADAHHGFTGRYDSDAPLWLDGIVTAVSASPPHATVTIRLDGAPSEAPRANLPPENLPAEFTGPLAPLAFLSPVGGEGARSVAVEFPPTADFYALGGKLRAGDRVSIMALRNCRPPRQLRSQWIRLASGEIVRREGRLSYMARGCGEE